MKWTHLKVFRGTTTSLVTDCNRLTLIQGAAMSTLIEFRKCIKDRDLIMLAESLFENKLPFVVLDFYPRSSHRHLGLPLWRDPSRDCG